MKYKIIIISFFLIYILFPNQIISFQSKIIDIAIKKFEQKKSKSSVLIINAKTAKIEYVYNREFAFNGKFPPGSILKLWSAVIFLENPNLFNFDFHREIYCKGKFFPKGKLKFKEIDDKTFNLPIDKKTKKRYFKCALRDGHGEVNLINALIYSCNVYFLTYASRKPEKFYNLLINKWHLNESTGNRLKAFEDENFSFSRRPGSSFMSVAASIGEGGVIMVSLLKVAQTYAAFFENTPLLSPYEGDQKIKSRFPLEISYSHRDLISETLGQVFINGTLKDISIKNEKVQILAAKTGTGTHYKKRYTTHGWNVIYFCIRNKNYIMVTFVYKGSGMKEAGKLSEIVLNQL